MDRSEHLIVGGSWDIFHAGHRYIILSALDKGGKVDIGITSERMLEEKLEGTPQDSFAQRKANIDSFLLSLGRRDDVRLIKIDDFCGNAVEEGDKLLVSPENIDNAVKINERREQQGCESIEVEVLDKLEDVEDKPISCTRIRVAKIDMNGLLN